MSTLSLEPWAKLSEIDPELKKVIPDINKPPQLAGTWSELRNVLEQKKKAAGSGSPSHFEGVIERDITIPSSDGHEISVRIYSPEQVPPGGSPLVVMIHGGGWCLGGLENEEHNCRRITQFLGCVCLNVDYRLAPEHPYPAAVNDCWAVIHWAASHSSKLKADLSVGFVVGGVSAGGNLAAVTALLARDTSLSPPLTGQLLIIPAVLSADVVPKEYQSLYKSFVQNANAPILPAAFVEKAIKAYAPDTGSWKFNPFIHPQGHRNLPPSYFMVCGMDPVRDEGLLYEKRLRQESAVKTQLKVYPGLPHSFWTFWPQLDVSKSYYEDVITAVKWLLRPHA